MSGLGAAWTIATGRIGANRRLAAALLLGFVVAAALLASTTIYARAMADLGLGYAIRSRLQVPPVTRIVTFEQGYPIGTTAARAGQDAIERRLHERLGRYSSEFAHYVRMPAFTLTRPNETPPQSKAAAVVQVQAIDGLERHVRLTSGSLPGPTAATGAVPEFQIAVSAGAAAYAGIAPGDRILLSDTFDDCERHPPREDQPPDPPCTPHTTVTRAVPALVTGLIEPSRPDDPFWVDGANGYFSGRPPTPLTGAIIPAFLPAATMRGAFADTFAGYWATQAWFAYAGVSRLNRDNVPRARAELDALRDDASAAGLLGSSTLATALESFDLRLSYDRVPLLVLVLQIAAIALFYVAIVAAMAVERQQREDGLLRSRGASVRQILAIYLIEGLLLAVPATLLGPFVGAGFTRLLGATSAFHAVTGGQLIAVQIDATAFALAALGAALSVAALLLPALLTARFTGVTLRRQAGRPQPPLVQRYYLDLGLMVICAVLLLELRARGSVFKPGTAGGLASDPLLLLAPALFTLALAALVLRLYPLVLRIAARLFAAGSGVTMVLSLWQMTRNASQYTRLGLLLMMGVAVGAYAASYSDTTTRSYRERALYQAGVDLRGALPSAGGDLGNFAATDQAVAGVPGVTAASSAMRLEVEPATLASAGVSVAGQSVQLLGVDPAAARSMLWYRTGLSHESLAGLMGHLGLPTFQIGKPIAGSPASFSLWANPIAPRDNVTAWARFRDADGRYQMYELGKLGFTGWQQLTAPLLSAGTPPHFPVSLVAIVLTGPPVAQSAKSDPIFFDDFAVVQPDGQQQPVEEFEGVVSWTAAPVAGADQDELAASSEQKHGGSRSLRFTFRAGVTNELRGFYVSDVNVPLPAIVSRDFAARTGVEVGGTTSLRAGDRTVPVRVQAIASLFPTLDPSAGPFVIVNRTHLVEWLDRFFGSTVDRPTEIWATAAPNADRQAILRQLAGSPYRVTGIVDRAAALGLDGADPLIAAGGSGILLVSFVAALVLAAGAFLVALYTSFNRRRVEFAVMAALGIGRGRLLAMLACEYGVLAAIAAAAGVWLGLGISRVMLSFLTLTESGAKVVPPFVLVTNWRLIGVALACLAVIVIGSLLLAARAYAHDPEGTALRGLD